MIPQRLKLAGFLCYKEEQTIEFDGSSLWLLSGSNGSGKSTVFDAVTFAIFGSHRGGSQSATDLLNKESNSFSIDFEFTIDDDRYSIRRTAKKPPKGSLKGTQNIFQYDRDSEKWIAIPDTNLVEGFKNWIRDKIGFTYETFTSSVLLLQGKAEKLLDSTPKGRSEVLAGVVDLERYQKLHEKADLKRKELKLKIDSIEGQLSGMPEVTELDFLAAENRVTEAETALTASRQEIDKLRDLEYQSRQFQELKQKILHLKERQQKSKTLMGEATVIQKNYDRLTELQRVIPHIAIIQEKQQTLANSQTSLNQLGKLKEHTRTELETLAQSIETARKKKTALKVSLDRDEESLKTIAKDLSASSSQLQQFRNYEDESAKLKQLETDLKRYPGTLTQDIERLQVSFDRVVELGQVYPLLDRYANLHAKLNSTSSRLTELQEQLSKLRQTGDKAKAEHEKAKARFDEASKLRKSADEDVTSTRTIYDQAKSAQQELLKNEGSQICRACGQILTPGHIQEEKVRRDRECKDTAARNRDAVKARDKAAANEASLQAELQLKEKTLTELREKYLEISNEIDFSKKEIEKNNVELLQVQHSIPKSYQQKITAEKDWPNAQSLTDMRRESQTLESIRSQLHELQEKNNRAKQIQTQIESKRETLTLLKRGIDLTQATSLRERVAKLEAEQNAVDLQVRGFKKQIQETDTELEKLAKLDLNTRDSLSNIDAQISAEEATQIQLRQSIENEFDRIPKELKDSARNAGFAQLLQWKEEFQKLQQNGTEQLYRDLTTTKATLESLEIDLKEAEQKEGQFPEDARLPVIELQQRLTIAKKNTDSHEKDLSRIREEKAVLERHRDQTAKLRTEKLKLEKEMNYSKMLAELLGRDRLQRFLLRTAEFQIVDYANGILDRLSGGQLFLKLSGGDDGTGAEKALELEAINRNTGSSPINVAFLSGSQRFRVAVSLALAIGQYASKQHRPIESVIIDEGFGCLDRTGRQTMIQELQNLRTQLKCILLVSHQEEFAEAFPNSYRFELINGSTKVSLCRK